MAALTDFQIEFIELNKGKMKQKEIAAVLNVTPACVCIRIRNGAAKNEHFDLNEFKKYYQW